MFDEGVFSHTNVVVTVHVAMPAEAGHWAAASEPVCDCVWPHYPHYPQYNQLVTPAPAADLDSC